MNMHPDITSLETFNATVEFIKKNLTEQYLKDKMHRHFVLPIMSDGSIVKIDFDEAVNSAMKIGNTNDLGRCKSIVYRAIGDCLRATEATGYFEIFESYAIMLPADGDVETKMDQVSEMINKYGSTMADLPGRKEHLMLMARWRDQCSAFAWEIKRFGNGPDQIVTLNEAPEIFGADFRPGPSRQSHLWAAIDDTTGCVLLKPEERPQEKSVSLIDKYFNRRIST